MNKNDVFREKIKEKNISEFFHEYDKKHDRDVQEGMKFFEAKFTSLSQKPGNLYVFRTNAIDTENMRHVLRSCTKYIVKMNLKEMWGDTKLD